MKTAIFEVLSNLKVDATLHMAGTVIEEEIQKLTQCIETGIVRIIENATTIDEGKAIVAEKAAVAAAAPAAVIVEPENTFGPKPDGEGESTTTDQETGNTNEVVVKFSVLKEFEITNKESKNFGIHKVGDVIEANPEAAQSMVDNGTLELFVEKKDDTVVIPTAGDNL